VDNLKKIVCLIDPSWDYHKLLKLINNNWNSIKDEINIWVGCAKDNGKRTKEVLENLNIPLKNKFLFPGTVRQGIYGGGKVSAVYIPKVIGNHFSLKRFFINILVEVGTLSLKLIYPKTKRIKYLYLVLSRKTRVGKKVDASELSDSEALKLIKKSIKQNPKINHVYVEGGSNAKHSIAERLQLLKNIKNVIDIPLYCGGGIRNIKEFKDTIKIADVVVIGHYFGENPEKILEFVKAIKKENYLE